MHHLTRSVAIVCLAATAACAPKQTGLAPITDADRAAIKATIDSALAIANAPTKDWAAYVKAYYADDAVVYQPNGPAIKGAANLPAFFASFPPLTNIRFDSDLVEGAGDRVTIVGRYSFTETPPGSGPIPEAGKFMEIWTRQPNGGWRSQHDLFNSDTPLAPAPAPA